MYEGPSKYLEGYYQRKEEERAQKEREWEEWNGPERRGPKGLGRGEIKEIEWVRCAVQTVLYGLEGGEIWDEKEKRHRRLVDYGVLEKALEVLQRYEKLLTEEPLVEQIADDWWKAGAFCEGVKGEV